MGKRNFLHIGMMATSLITSASYAQSYSIKDLEILEKQQAYSEFLHHAKDILPIKRDLHWKRMVQNAGVGFIKQKIKRKEFNEETFKKIESWGQWPTMAQDEFYQLKRNQYALTYFRECLFINGAKSCEKEIELFWTRAKKTPDLANEMAKIYRAYYPKKSKWNFHQFLVQSPVASFYCDKEPIKKSLYNYLQKEVQIDTSFEQVKNIIKKTMHADCWDIFKKELKGELNSDSLFKLTLAFKALKAKGELTKHDVALFYVTYLLTGPSKSDLFNYAWKNLEKLGHSPELRQKVLNSLKERTLLPGKVFSSSNINLKQAILKLLAENFHEYIDHYVHTCLNYLQGNGHFPLGNPTMECDDLFAIKTKSSVIEQSLKVKHSALRKTNH